MTVAGSHPANEFTATTAPGTHEVGAAFADQAGSVRDAHLRDALAVISSSGTLWRGSNPMHRRRVLVSLLSLASLLWLASCSRQSSEPTAGTAPSTGSAPSGGGALKKVGLLVTGPVSDGGWNEIAWKGCQQIKDKYGAEINNQLVSKPEQYESSFRGYGSSG